VTQTNDGAMSRAFETLRVAAVAPHVERVVLHRPAVANAMDTRLGEELTAYFEALALDDRDLRCIVVTGHGDTAFCAGADLKERRGMTDDAWQRQHRIFERMIRALLFCPLPIVGAVNGVAYGGGVEIAAACDFLYAAPHARFALTEVTLGILPGCGGTQTLPRAIGVRRAKELILTGRPFSAEEAERWGLVNRIVPAADLATEAVAAAAAIAANAPVSVRQAKQAIDRGSALSLADALAFEIEAYGRTVPTEDRREGILAFNEKRRPRFTGR
jgi:enoyl-CoA hydratase/carnithine racemase